MRSKVFLGVIFSIALAVWVTSCGGPVEETTTSSITGDTSTTTSSSSTTTSTVPEITISSISVISIISNNDAGAVACSGDYAYCVGWNDVASNFCVVDLSAPAAPSREGFLSAGYGYGIAVNGNTVYVQTDGMGDGLFGIGSVVAVDVTDPANPAPVMRDTSGYDSAYQTYYYNNYVFNCSRTIFGIYDVSDPDNLVHVTNIPTSACEYATLADDYLYTLDNGTFKIFDVQNPASFSLIGSTNISAIATTYGCAVGGNYAYVMGLGKNIAVFDIADKSAPVLLTNIVYTEFTSLYLKEAKILGHYLLVTGTTQFIVFDLDNPAAPSYVDSIDYDHSSGNGFDILQNRYAVVSDDTVYYVIQLY